MTSKTSSIPGFQNWVFLHPQPERWQLLPARVQKALRKKRREIRDIRASIAEEAKVPVMPPVEILDTAWRVPDPAFPYWGAVGGVLVGENVHFGAVFPGASILALDADTIRYFLLGAFCKCFWFERQLLEHLDSSGNLRCCPWREDPSSEYEPYLRGRENPVDWFGGDDAVIAAREFADPRQWPYLDTAAVIASEWVEMGLPVEDCPSHLPGTDTAGPVGIDCATIAHIRALGSESKSCQRRSAALAHTGTISVWLGDER